MAYAVEQLFSIGWVEQLTKMIAYGMLNTKHRSHYREMCIKYEYDPRRTYDMVREHENHLMSFLDKQGLQRYASMEKYSQYFDDHRFRGAVGKEQPDDLKEHNRSRRRFDSRRYDQWGRLRERLRDWSRERDRDRDRHNDRDRYRDGDRAYFRDRYRERNRMRRRDYRRSSHSRRSSRSRSSKSKSSERREHKSSEDTKPAAPKRQRLRTEYSSSEDDDESTKRTTLSTKSGQEPVHQIAVEREAGWVCGLSYKCNGKCTWRGLQNVNVQKNRNWIFEKFFIFSMIDQMIYVIGRWGFG